LLVCEVREWEQLFWNKFKVFRDQIGNDRVEEKDRLTREWRTNCWKRLDPQMDAALKRLADADMIYNDVFLKALGEQWALSIRLFFEGVADPGLISLSGLKEETIDDGTDYLGDETRLQMKKEIEDIEFRLKRGSDLGRFDQFWDNITLFECRYSRSKWLHFTLFRLSPPPEIYSHALKGNQNIIHITFGHLESESESDFDVNRFLYDLPLVTSSSSAFGLQLTPAIHRDPLFIKSSNNDLNTFAEKIRPELLDDSTYIFLDAGMSPFYSGRLGGNARFLISFVAPTYGKSLLLRVKHSGEEDMPLKVTLGSTKIQLNPPSKSSLTIDDIILYPIRVPGPSESDHLSFTPEVRNDIDIQFIGPAKFHGHFLHDIELLDEAGLEYMPHMPHSASLSILSN
jgi:hypothetical protein